MSCAMINGTVLYNHLYITPISFFTATGLPPFLVPSLVPNKETFQPPHDFINNGKVNYNGRAAPITGLLHCQSTLWHTESKRSVDLVSSWIDSQ